ncbi:MAG TPA: gluconokinase [Nocardioidaceae bacterium]|nr:gluconokinase [Nocardioidaceae bacterium]
MVSPIAPHDRSTRCVVVMGVAGSGKTAVGRMLADRLGWAFVDGDELHPPQNVEKMRAGVPLDDADRGPWLRAVSDWIVAQHRDDHACVVACSALKRPYRDQLRESGVGITFVHLDLPFDVAVARVSARSGHFMPAELARSQFGALEPLGEDESGHTVDATGDLDSVVAKVADLVGRPA